MLLCFCEYKQRVIDILVYWNLLRRLKRKPMLIENCDCTSELNTISYLLSRTYCQLTATKCIEVNRNLNIRNGINIDSVNDEMHVNCVIITTRSFRQFKLTRKIFKHIHVG